MRPFRSPVLLLSIGLASALAVSGCAKKDTAVPSADAGGATGATGEARAGDGKIPISTTSPQAKDEFVQGRDKVEKLLITDSLAHFRKAIELDPSFAWAELALAQNSPTGTEFFEHLNKAVVLSEKASDGERLLILAAQAGSNNDALGQKQYLDQLLAAYPDDERANFAVA